MTLFCTTFMSLLRVILSIRLTFSSYLKLKPTLRPFFSHNLRPLCPAQRFLFPTAHIPSYDQTMCLLNSFIVSPITM